MKDINPVLGISQKNEKPGKENPAQLKKAVADFEALFINQMLKEMRNTISKSGFLHGARGRTYIPLFLMESFQSSSPRAEVLALKTHY